MTSREKAILDKKIILDTLTNLVNKINNVIPAWTRCSLGNELQYAKEVIMSLDQDLIYLATKGRRKMTKLKGVFVLKYASGYTQQRTRALVRLGKNERLDEYTCSCVRRGPEIGDFYGFNTSYAKSLMFLNLSHEDTMKSLTLYIYCASQKLLHVVDLAIEPHLIHKGSNVEIKFDRHPVCYEVYSSG